MTISLRIAEIQRAVAQLEDELEELAHYGPREREAAAGVLAGISLRIDRAAVVLETNPQPPAAA